MSQHVFPTEYKGRQVEVLMGWDRPLQGYFMVVEEGDRADGYVYTNLDDPALADSMGLPPTLDHFVAKLSELGINVPPRIFDEVKMDARLNVGNRYVVYDATGRVRT